MGWVGLGLVGEMGLEAESRSVNCWLQCKRVGGVSDAFE